MNDRDIEGSDLNDFEADENIALITPINNKSILQQESFEKTILKNGSHNVTAIKEYNGSSYYNNTAAPYQ